MALGTTGAIRPGFAGELAEGQLAPVFQMRAGRAQVRAQVLGGVELTQRMLGADAPLQVDVGGEERLLRVRVKGAHPSKDLDINLLILFNK
jgi:hypothetical protein